MLLRLTYKKLSFANRYSICIFMRTYISVVRADNIRPYNHLVYYLITMNKSVFT